MGDHNKQGDGGGNIVSLFLHPAHDEPQPDHVLQGDDPQQRHPVRLRHRLPQADRVRGWRAGWLVVGKIKV